MIMDFFMVVLLSVVGGVTGYKLLYTGSGLDLSPGAALALGLGSGKGSGAEGQSDEGCYGNNHDLFHSDSPYE
jgi:hypothetical protein